VALPSASPLALAGILLAGGGDEPAALAPAATMAADAGRRDADDDG